MQASSNLARTASLFNEDASLAEGVSGAMARIAQAQPSAGVCQSVLRQVLAPGSDIIVADSLDVLALLRLPELRLALPG